MFSLSLSALRRATPKHVLPTNPWDWSKEGVLNFLDSLNSRKARDREEVQRHIKALAAAIRLECSGGPYSSVEDVLKADPEVLPIGLKAYRELYEYMLVWLR